jgi:hypothetical protein
LDDEYWVLAAARPLGPAPLKGADGQIYAMAQGNLLADLSACMNALYKASVQLNVTNSVTQFTASDFSRTFPVNSDSGADHAWGVAETLQDGAEFGTGNKAATGLVRLPNLGAVKWRKTDNSGDLGMALNASDHVAMDAVIDFAAGQTFGAFSYPDATTTSKGIVQIDPVGGIAVAAGVLSLAATGVVAGTYPKVTVDATLPTKYGQAEYMSARTQGDLWPQLYEKAYAQLAGGRLKAAAAKDTQAKSTVEASMAKLAASEAAHKAADKAMQILASAGYRRGSVVERLFRDVRATEIYQGTSEAQRMIIAANVLANV